MILKIERYLDKAENDPFNWWMVDGIKRVHRIKFKSAMDKDADNLMDAGTLLLDYGHYLEQLGHSKPAERDVIRLNCRFEDGSERSILFDTIAYILNDEGKTIEKLVANYR